MLEPPAKHRLLVCLAAALLIALGLVALDASRSNSATIDELGHPVAGMAYWQRGDFFVYHHNPPLLRLLMALPVMASCPVVDYSRCVDRPDHRVEQDMGRDFMFANRDRFPTLLSRARWIPVGFTVLGGLLLLWWGWELYGPGGGLVALGLWATEPLVISHGGLATTDVGAAVVGLAAAYAFWHYLRRPGWPTLLAAGLVLGLALLSKFSALLLVPIFLIVWAAQPTEGEQAAEPVAGGHLMLLLLVAWLVLHAGYAFKDSCRPLGEFQFVSSTFTGKPPYSGPGNRWAGTWRGRIPAPMPAEYLRGIDAQKSDFERGWKSYLRGEVRTDGWYYYYLYAQAVKTPPGTLILIVVVLVLVFQPQYRLTRTDELLLLLPVLLLHAVLAWNTGMNHHLRYALPVYPFLFLFLARAGTWAQVSRWGRTLVVACLVLNGVSVARVHPQELAYFNEFAGGPQAGHLHLLESNIDWGQDLIRLKAWMSDHPEARPFYLAYHSLVDPGVYGIDYLPAPFGPCAATAGVPSDELGPWPGWFAVSTNSVMGRAFYSPDGAQGLRPPVEEGFAYFQRFEPVARPGYGMFVYHITFERAQIVRGELGLPLLEKTP